MRRSIGTTTDIDYQVEVDLRGGTSVSGVTYQWPQAGLQAAHGSGAEPSKGFSEAHQGDLPPAPLRTVGRPDRRLRNG
ncbi:hypothetical protein ABZV24_19560 [Streptomyces sp. NPDC005251]|uniref:hypothetical protein n=1 Tax=Streptomyces sp. NPDC005251 TaxID=3157166 RepID=UPI00339FDDF4